MNGDLPKLLVHEFCHELAEPLSYIFNNITKTGNWPEYFKLECGIPIKMISNPVIEDNLRIISLTPLYSKNYEKNCPRMTPSLPQGQD